MIEMLDPGIRIRAKDGSYRPFTAAELTRIENLYIFFANAKDEQGLRINLMPDKMMILWMTLNAEGLKEALE